MQWESSTDYVGYSTNVLVSSSFTRSNSPLHRVREFIFLAIMELAILQQIVEKRLNRLSTPQGVFPTCGVFIN